MAIGGKVHVSLQPPVEMWILRASSAEGDASPSCVERRAAHSWVSLPSSTLAGRDGGDFHGRRIGDQRLYLDVAEVCGAVGPRENKRNRASRTSSGGRCIDLSQPLHRHRLLLCSTNLETTINCCFHHAVCTCYHVRTSDERLSVRSEHHQTPQG